MWEVTEESKSDYLEILNHRMVMLCIEIGGLGGGREKRKQMKVVLSSKLMETPLPENIPGLEMMKWMTHSGENWKS